MRRLAVGAIHSPLMTSTRRNRPPTFDTRSIRDASQPLLGRLIYPHRYSPNDTSIHRARFPLPRSSQRSNSPDRLDARHSNRCAIAVSDEREPRLALGAPEGWLQYHSGPAHLVCAGSCLAVMVAATFCVLGQIAVAMAVREDLRQAAHSGSGAQAGALGAMSRTTLVGRARRQAGGCATKRSQSAGACPYSDPGTTLAVPTPTSPGQSRSQALGRAFMCMSSGASEHGCG